MCSSFSALGQKMFNKFDIDPRPQNLQIDESIYLVGDAGEDPENQSGIQMMLPMLEKDPNGAVVFLGDNIYPRGLHGKNHDLRKQDEDRIIGQMSPMKDHPGPVVFIPGNHDWEQGGVDGLKMLKRQQKFVEKYLGDDDNFMPDKGCPGPEVLEMGDVVMIIIDTQWWLHKHDRSVGEADGCDVIDEISFVNELKEVLKKNRRKHVVLVGHHPLKSNGEHGGRFTLKDHLFPLTTISERAYLPLPGLGSIYPLYRSLCGDIQDIAHPVNREMTNALLDVLGEYENVVYAAGHEHNLQYFAEGENHLVVSGAGSKITHVGASRDLGFGAEFKGFARLSYYADGRVWLEYFTDQDGKTVLSFSRMIYQKNIVRAIDPDEVEAVGYHGQTAKVIGDSVYHARRVKRFLMGSLNRELWLRPIEVPFLDIHKVHGGLHPLKLGGGQQSISMRLKGGDGHQYVVRQIKKNATFLVEKDLRNTLAQEVIYDGIAGSHPYAAIAIPRLSDPLGIYHTNPQLVYVPKDSMLSDLGNEFAGTFCMFEERPDGDMSHMKSMGKSKEVIGYGDLIEEVHESHKHRVDERFTLRNRLFDILIGDWDRHDDQWRWASFKGKEKTIYRPIPRDRDQAFFKFDGLLPSLSNRKWALRKFQNFEEDIRDVNGLCFNARYFDRSWLTQMNKADWQEETKYIQNHLNDHDIDAAIDLFPKVAYDFNGDFLKETLRARRNKLMEFSEEYYAFLARSVDVVGTLDSDYFEVKRLGEDSLSVSVYPFKKQKLSRDDRFYHRVFVRSETKEIILYGLGGDDHYEISGEVENSILVRIVGGEDRDKVIDRSKVNGLRKYTHYYDDLDGNEITADSELRTHLRSGENVPTYDRKGFKYDTYLPLPYLGYNPDDKIFLGGGVSWTKFGFDKHPFRSRQLVRANVAFGTGSYNIKYSGAFTELFGPFDFGIIFQANRPFIFQYNGAGNETEEIDLDFSRVRLDQINLRPHIALSNESGSSALEVYALISNVVFDDEDDDEPLGITGSDNTFLGAGVKYKYHNVDDDVAPHRGFRFSASIDRSKGLFDGDDDINFTHIEGDLALYLPLGFMPTKTTLAVRSGLAHNDGTFNFYQANFIGGQREFRGVRRNRYAGHTSQFNNVDIRVDIREINNRTLPFNIGVLGHADLGRVWLEGEDSDRWHRSVGGGVYFDILGFITLNATYSVSDGGNAFLIQGGFFF